MTTVFDPRSLHGAFAEKFLGGNDQVPAMGISGTPDKARAGGRQMSGTVRQLLGRLRFLVVSI